MLRKTDVWPGERGQSGGKEVEEKDEETKREKGKREVWKSADSSSTVSGGSRDGGCCLCVRVCEVTLTLIGVTRDNLKSLNAHIHAKSSHTCFLSAAGVADIKMISAERQIAVHGQTRMCVCFQTDPRLFLIPKHPI